VTSDYLVISAIGEDRPGLVSRLTGVIAEHGCNVEDSRMSVLGTEFAVILLLSGDGEAVRRVGKAARAAGEELGLLVNVKPTTARPTQAVADRVPYEVHAVCLDHPGVVHEISHFLAQRQINIDDLTTATYPAPVTGAPMFSLRMQIEVPAGQRLSALRRELAEFCDRLGVDSEIRPTKG
jgi:glycine cleavage system transcriptional repressor